MLDEELKEIDSVDPKIVLKDRNIILLPYYWYYSFIMNFVFIGGGIYTLSNLDDTLLSLALILSIGLIIILIFGKLLYSNTVSFKPHEKEVLVQTNWWLKSFRKNRTITFEEIKNISVSSNYDSGGFWRANRRWFIVLLLKDEDEIKIISSGNEVAVKKLVGALLKLTKHFA
jgi:hypothetical protein